MQLRTAAMTSMPASALHGGAAATMAVTALQLGSSHSHTVPKQLDAVAAATLRPAHPAQLCPAEHRSGQHHGASWCMLTPPAEVLC